jgi:hypothetical protein
VKWLTYQVDYLILGEAVLAELAHELLHFHSVTAEQVGETLEDVHNVAFLNSVVEFKQVEHLGHLLLQINAQKLGAIKNKFHCVGVLNSILSQRGEGLVEFLSSFGQNVRVLNYERADELLRVAMLADEVIVNYFDARRTVIVVQHKSRLVPHYELELLKRETVLLLKRFFQ